MVQSTRALFICGKPVYAGGRRHSLPVTLFTHCLTGQQKEEISRANTALDDLKRERTGRYGEEEGGDERGFCERWLPHKHLL